MTKVSILSRSEEILSIPGTHLDGVVALREMPLLLGLLLGDEVLLVLGHSPADGAGLLRAEVERQVLLALVEDAELGALVGVDDGEDTGDRLADVVAVGATLVSMRLCSGCEWFHVAVSLQ